MDEQLSLFGDEPANAAQQTVNSSGKLTVTQLSFVEGTEMTWKELFPVLTACSSSKQSAY